MARVRRLSSVKAIECKAEESMWGMPESPEFSAVERLVHEFQEHENEEGRWLALYKQIAAEADDPMVKLLLNLIIADEEKHCELMGRVVASLKDDLVWTRAERAAQHPFKEKDQALRQMVNRFLQVERRGIAQYEKLIKASQRFHQDLVALLCQTMVHDSLKHIGILEFLGVKLSEKRSGTGPRKRPTRRL